MTTQPELTPEILMGQYILGAYMLGTRFPHSEPLPNYVDESVAVMIRDLKDHGYILVTGSDQ